MPLAEASPKRRALTRKVQYHLNQGLRFRALEVSVTRVRNELSTIRIRTCIDSGFLLRSIEGSPRPVLNKGVLCRVLWVRELLGAQTSVEAFGFEAFWRDLCGWLSKLGSLFGSLI